MKNLHLMRSIAIDALFIALFVLFTFVPYLGYIQVGPISIQIMHLFVLIGACIFGWKKGLFYGFIFGLTSLIKASMYPGTIDFAFLNPFVSILPRALFGLIAGVVFDLIKKHTNIVKFSIVAPFLCFAFTCLHTVLTMSCLYVFGVLDPFHITSLLGLSNVLNSEAFLALISTAALVNMLVESAIAFVIVLPAYLAIRQIKFVKEIDDNKFKVVRA